jgi:hypothetical protein
VLYLFVLVANIYTLTQRQDASNVYVLNKQVELFTLSKAASFEELSVHEFRTRTDLYEYLTDILPSNMFLSQDSLDKVQTAKNAGTSFDYGDDSEGAIPPLQKDFEIIGKI